MTISFKNKITEILLTIILLTSLINITNTHKKLYIIYKFNYDERISNLGDDFCNKSGIGYIHYIKNKFRNIIDLNIINLKQNRDYSWIFFDKKNINININSKYTIILFNLDHFNKFKFNLSNYKIIDNYKNDCLLIKKND